MPISHLHKDVKTRGYFSGVFTVLRDRGRLRKAYAERYAGHAIEHGWYDLDPHFMDIAVDGKPLARIESHHGKEDIHVYEEHPAAQEFVEEALRQGYSPEEPKS